MSDSGPDTTGSSGEIRGREILPVNIEDELRQSYLDYAMSVIVGRALPDVRDGLKPVHKRILFAMNEMNNTYNRPYMKSARVSGEVMGKYHPHGEAAIYDTIVRMAQDFSMRYELVDGQGNFGSIDGDPPAAARYTEVRMAKFASELLADLEMDTVDFVPNYDETLMMPEVLPTRVPNLLLNGASGIAVGLATNIPPHNLREVVDACIMLLDAPETTVDGLMEHIQGPDFPTAGIINGRAGIVQAYRTGRGRIKVRARAEVRHDEDSNKDTIVITEIPYQLNKSRLLEKIAELVREKRIEGITELRDESDKDGLRIVIELRRGEQGEVVLNNLYAQTQLQSGYGINCVALVGGQPKVLGLKDMLAAFISHRREVVIRRTIFLLRRARRRGHLLEGQAVALENIDEVVELIRSSPTPAAAREELMSRRFKSESVAELIERSGGEACRPEELDEEYGYRDGVYRLSEEQAQAILDMQLQRLTALQKDRLMEEYLEILQEISRLLELLGSEERLKDKIREELIAVREEYGDDRRTEIRSSEADLTVEDLINEEDMVVTVSHAGYAKTQSLDVYQAQARGGRGKAATAVKDEDFVEHLLIAHSHETLLCFSNRGKVYWLRVFQIPQGSRGAKGRPLVNLLPLETDERITTLLPIKDLSADTFVFMATASGKVKKTPAEQFSRPRTSGLIALDLEPGNHLVDVAITDGYSDVMLVTSSGKAVRFKESDVRAMGRTARGVRGVRLRRGQSVISLIIPEENGLLLTASENGFGKRTRIDEFPVKGRGGLGVIAMQTSDRNGPIIGAAQVFEGDEIMLISNLGTLVRTGADGVPTVGRNTQGVKLIALKGDAKLVGLERIVETENGEDGEDDQDSEDDA